MEVPTRAEMRKLRVVDLRQKLSKLGLSQGGLKEDLITRVLSHYEEQAAKALQEEASEVPAQEEATEVSVQEASAEVEDENGRGEEGEEEAMEVSMEEEVLSTTTNLDVPASTAAVEPEPAREAPAPPPNQDTQSDSLASAPTPATPTSENVVDTVTPSSVLEEVGGAEAGDDGARHAGTVEPAEDQSVSTPPGPHQNERDSESVGDSGMEDTNDPPSDVVAPSSEIAAPLSEVVAPPSEIVAPPSEVIATPSEVSAPPSDQLPEEPMGPPVPADPAPSSDYFSDSARVRDEPADKGEKEERTILPAKPTPSDLAQLGGPKSAEGKSEGKGKKKKKKKRRRRHQGASTPASPSLVEPSEIEIEYVQEDILDPSDQHYRQFHKIFEQFKLVEQEKKPDVDDSLMETVTKTVSSAAKGKAAEEDSDEEEENEQPKISKKKLRKLNRLSVAELKQLVERPDVVEMHDVTANDPKLLIHLKSARNTVPVPRHWCFKRKYLQGKRGIEKPPFSLPDFIRATGISEMRQAFEEKEEQKSLKQKTRERVRPKMGKLMIDYQKLHDAFFKWQTKPKMSIHGDLYYEGKEFETRLREKKPGDLSDELRRALGMPTGLGKQKFPPPWLVAMQRYGPPPSYPNLKIPGLNAPIPEGCSFGYFVGGWGKPPVDEQGRPLYGDVFGVDQAETGTMVEEEVDQTLWGQLESEEEEASEEEEESGGEEEGPGAEDIQAGLVTPIEGLVTPSGLTSIPAGLETPEMIQLRKKKIEEAMEQGGETPVLYTVLPEKAAAVGGAMMGSSHVYDIAGATPGNVKKTSGSGGEGIEVSLDPSELELDAATMTARYEEQLREHQGQIQKEDLSDMVAEHTAKQKKRKRAAGDSGGGKATKKLKEFKF